ncbi:Deoxyribodipyrimidine photo-lyase [Dictyocoela muelleri]|nr:Deoxyribodipyrimidine photo-lyase [Dictyocoela muelleri]
MERIEKIVNIADKDNVLYITHRDQRIYDNYSVELGYKISYSLKSQFIIGFVPNSFYYNNRQAVFFEEGLEEMRKDALNFNLNVEVIDEITEFVKNNKIGTIIVDYCPLKKCLEFVETLKKLNLALYSCDSHNLVPCKLLKTYVRTSKAVKVRLYDRYSEFLKDFSSLRKHKYNKKRKEIPIKIPKNISRPEYFELLKNKFGKMYKEEHVVKDFKGGYSEGMRQVELFFNERFHKYDKERNNPNTNALSNLSPWLHAGHISAQKVILMASKRFSSDDPNLLTFLNEIFVWKETAEHFCMHNRNYEKIEAALPWAQTTLKNHASDKRDVYSISQLESAQTKDKAWNAAMKELFLVGKIHGYVRMYWAKQLLFYTATPEDALATALYLNDKYSIDGFDPNGYLGIMWCICGSMDRAFKEREVFGKIRPMKAYKSSKYISKWLNL